MASAADDPLQARLAEVVGAEHVLADPDLRAPYETDWTGRWHGGARLVVRPGTGEEVAATLLACGRDGVPVVPQGGNTGLVGGGVPRGGEVLLSLARLDELGDVDGVAGQLTAGAGVTLAAARRQARAAGWDVGVDLAARDSATIGGMVATNAGGINVLRHGMMRASVAGVEAALAGGSVVRRLSGLAKDNTGYDLSGLLCGSEGTLGVITRVRLRLVPRRDAAVTVLTGLPGVGAALALLPRLRAKAPSLQAVEYVDASAFELVREHGGLPHPLRHEHPTYLLVECATAGHDPLPELAEALGELDDVAVARDRPGRAALWAYRERITEAVVAAGVPHKLDVTVPPGSLGEFERSLRARLGEVAPAARLVLFGHLADGNAHVNLLGAPLGDEAVDAAVLHLVAELGGSISAEHGIGVAKRRWLHLSRSPAEIDAMRALKVALDPGGILNPGVLLPERA